VAQATSQVACGEVLERQLSRLGAVVRFTPSSPFRFDRKETTVYRRFVLALALVGSATVLPLASAHAATSSSSCIVSLSPSATQTLFAIGAGPQVRAVDRDATWPVGKLPALRIDAFNPSAESIAGLCPTSASHPSRKPDLVVISYDANSIKQKLRALGVRVVEQDAPSTLAAAYDQMRQLGTLTGRVNEANALVRRLKNHLAADVRRVPAHAAGDVRVYYELDPTFYAAASSTFVGSLLAQLGVTNIADAASTSADAGYPQLNQEFIVSANPTVVLLADTVCCGASPATVAARTGWSTLDAVVNNNVYGLNDSVASTWGPLLGTLMDRLTNAVSRSLAVR